MENTIIKGKVLVIDDTISIIDMVKTALVENNYQVLVATSGTKGIKSAIKAQPDLVLLDILMPEIDGYETCRELKKNVETEHIPVIFMSALSEVFDKVKAFNLGAVDYITKPLNVEELLARVGTQVSLYRMQQQLKDTNVWLEKEVEMRTQELRESHEKYQTVADFTHDWEYWILPDGSIEYMSPSCERITGYTVSEFIENPELLNKIIHVDDRNIWDSHIKHISENNDDIEVAFRINTKSGKVIWIGHVCSRVYDYNRNFNGTRVSNRDITAIKKAEEQIIHKNHELQAAEEELRAANDALKENLDKLHESESLLKESQKVGKVASWEYDFIRNILTWSDEVFRMLGFAPGAFEPNIESYLNYIHPDDREKVNVAYQNSVQQKIPYEVEHRFIKNDTKKVIVVKETGQNIYDEKGNPIKSIGMTIDITEQKKHELKLKEKNEELQAAEEELVATNDELRDNIIKLTENEVKLNAAQKLAKLGHYNLDFTTGFWTSSKELNAIFGIDDSYEKNVEGWLNIVHPEFREIMQNYFMNEVVGKKQCFNKEYKIINQQSNKELWVHGLGELDFNESGTLISMIGSIQDITQRKIIEIEKEKTNIELQHERDLLHSLMNNIPDTIYFKDKQARFTRVNKAQSKLLGIQNTEDAIGKTDFDFFDVKHAQDAFNDEQNIIKTGKPLVDKLEVIKNAEGETRYVSTTKVPIFDNNDRVISIVGATRDITEHKKIELALKDSEERFAFAMKASHDGLFDWNLETNEIYYSPMWKKILGYNDDELPNDFSVWETLTHPDDVKKSWEKLNEHIKGNTDRFEMEFKMKHKQGHWVPVLSRASAVFNAEGKAIRMVGTHVDLTEIRTVEKQLIESERLLKQSQEVAHVGSWSYSVKNDTLTWSDEVYRIFGYVPNEEELSFSFFINHVHPDDREKVEKAYNDSIQNKLSYYKIEHRIIKKQNNEVAYVLEKCQNYFDANGNFVESIGMVMDITEQTKSRMVLDNFFNQPMNLHIIAKINGIIEKVNVGWEKTLGYVESELVGSNFLDYVHPDDMESTLNEMKKLSEGETTFYFENRYRHKYGMYRTLAWSSIVSTEDSLIYAVATDVTEKKLAEQKLGKTNNSLQKIIHASAALSGQSYFNVMARTLEATTGATYSFIGEYINGNAVKTISLSHNGAILKNFTYNLENTPCENVINKETCFYPEKITEIFPKDQLLVDMGIEGYVGTPVFNHKKQCLGIIVSLYDKPLADSDFVKSMFEIFSGKIGAEMERLKAEKALIEKNEELQAAEEELKATNDELRYRMQTISDRENAISNIVNNTMGKSGDEFFYRMALVMKQVCESEYTFIGAITDDDSIKTLALVQNDKILDNFEYSLEGTPCDKVLTEDTCVYTNDVCSLFPEDKLLVELKVKAYLGTSIRDKENKRIGIIVSMYTSEIKESSFLRSLFEMFASKIGAEMERLKTEKALIEKNEELQAAEEELLASNDALKENLERLQESEDRFKALHNSSFGGIAIHDMGVILEANQGLSEITGFSYEELIGMNGLLLISEATREMVLENIKSQFEEAYEAEGVRKDGSTYPLRLEARQIPYKGKEVRVVEFRDITMQKEGEKKIKESEERFRILAENSPGVIYLCYNDATYSMVYLNDEVYRLTGYKKEDFYDGKISFVDLYHPKFIEEIRLNVDDALKVQQPFRLEYQLKTRNGEWRWIEEYGAGIFDGDKLQFIEGSLMDITERKNAELINQARLRIAEFSINHNANELLTYTLDETEKLTDSKIGFYHFVNEDDNSLTLHAWSTNTMENMCTAEEEDKHYAISKAGVWVDCIHKRKTVIHNNYESLKHKKGMPKGHAPVIREMVVPVLRNKKIVAVLGVGNKETNYSKGDVNIVEQLADIAFETVLRKRAEEEIRDERNRTLNIIEGTNAGTWEWWSAEDKLIINDRWAEMIGYKITDFEPTYDFWFNSVHEDDKAYVSKQVEAHLNGETEYYDVEFRQKHKEGHWVWINARGKIIERNSKGEAVRMTGTHLDITDKKLTELAFKENEQQLQLIFDSSPAIMFLINKNKQIVRMNKTGLEFLNTGIDMIYGVEAGQAFNCVVSIQDKMRCGQSYACNACAFKTSINNIIDTQSTQTKVETRLNIIHGNKIQAFTVLISTSIATVEPEYTYLVTVDDITERKKTETDLRKSEERFKDFANSVTDIYFALNNELKIIFWNKASESILGIKSEFVLGKSISELDADKKYDWVVQKFKECIKNNEKASFEATINQNNTDEYYIVNAYPTQSGIIVYLQDITQRKKAEFNLKESETRFRTIIESANDAIFISDSLSGEIIDANRKGEQLMGLSRELIVGTNIAELHPDGERSIAKKELSYKNINNKDLLITDLHIQHISGILIPVEISPAIITLANSKLYTVGFYRDVTKRKIAEDALLESESRFKLLVDVSIEGIILHKKGNIIDVNPAFCKLSGYTEKELIGYNIYENIIPEPYHDYVEQQTKKDSSGSYEINMRTKEGEIIPVAINSRFISKREKLRVASVRNISKEKEVQQQILQAIINTEENERKRVAQELHDGLGPVLSTVKLYTETFLKSDNEAFKAKIKDQLLIGINEALQQVSTISNNLSPHVLDDFGLKAAIERFIEKLHNVSATKFKFDYEIEETIAKEVETTLYRVTTELINNSLKYAEATLITIVLTYCNNLICFNYSDNGKGFEFDAIKDAKKGMGLFNIVNRVKSLNGQVDFKRGKEKGIHYLIEIPNRNGNKK